MRPCIFTRWGVRRSSVRNAFLFEFAKCQLFISAINKSRCQRRAWYTEPLLTSWWRHGVMNEWGRWWRGLTKEEDASEKKNVSIFLFIGCSSKRFMFCTPGPASHRGCKVFIFSTTSERISTIGSIAERILRSASSKPLLKVHICWFY